MKDLRSQMKNSDVGKNQVYTNWTKNWKDRDINLLLDLLMVLFYLSLYQLNEIINKKTLKNLVRQN